MCKQIKSKICVVCKIDKSINEFPKGKGYKNGIKARCRTCENEYNKIFRKEHPELEKKRREKYRNYYINYHREDRKNNPKKYIEYRKSIIEKTRQWKKDNKEYCLNYQYDYFKNRKENDPGFKMSCYLRSRIWSVIKQNKKSDQFYNLLGCSINELKNYIEKQFKKGMNWDNYGLKGWSIDHIIPCCKFDLSDPEQQKQCFHYSNLQPLWLIDNLKKNGKLIESQLKLII